MIIKEEIV